MYMYHVSMSINMYFFICVYGYTVVYIHTCIRKKISVIHVYVSCQHEYVYIFLYMRYDGYSVIYICIIYMYRNVHIYSCLQDIYTCMTYIYMYVYHIYMYIYILMFTWFIYMFDTYLYTCTHISLLYIHIHVWHCTYFVIQQEKLAIKYANMYMNKSIHIYRNMHIHKYIYMIHVCISHCTHCVD